MRSPGSPRLDRLRERFLSLWEHVKSHAVWSGVAARLIAGLIVVAAAGLVVTVTKAGDSATPTDVASGGPEPSSVPPAGSIVDAATGQVLDGVTVERPAMENGQIEGGDILRPCNLTATPDCPYNKRDGVVQARRGDRIRFRLRLHDPLADPVDYVKLHFSASQEGRDLAGGIWIEWPNPVTADSSFESIYDSAALRLPDDSPYDLAYVPGSTTLQESDAYGAGRTMAALPDGIMGGGAGSVILKEVGSPPDCWDCDLESIRFVEFDADVE